MAFPFRYRCFVMQPFGTRSHPISGRAVDNEHVYAALSALENIRPNFPIAIDRADVGSVEAERLHDHVISRIRDSDFCIADVTGQNPNVLYECGYARALGKSVIVICYHRDDVPSDLRELIVVPYGDNPQSLASNIDTHLDRVRRDVDEAKTRRWSKVEYFITRDHADIASRIRGATRRIDILQTNLTTISANYLRDIIVTMRNKPTLRLRLLTLNPQSIFVNYRGEQVGFGEDIALYREELDSNLKTVHFSLREFTDRVSIRIYDDFPNQIAFAFDDDILVCIVSATGRSRGNCAFLLPLDTPGAKGTFSDHFEKLWDDKSVKYPLEH